VGRRALAKGLNQRGVGCLLSRQDSKSNRHTYYSSLEINSLDSNKATRKRVDDGDCQHQVPAIHDLASPLIAVGALDHGDGRLARITVRLLATLVVNQA
jgi:hypothetical protein